MYRARWQALTRPFVRRATPVKISSSTADGIRAVGVDQTLKSRPTGSLPYLASWLSGKGLIVSLSWCKISNNSKRFLPKAGLGPGRVARKRFCSNVGSPTLFPQPAHLLSESSPLRAAKTSISVCEFILELLSSNGLREKAERGRNIIFN